MKKDLAVNTFDLGLIMDLNPIVTPNNILTNCLNGTLITFNGNENVLLNDMGNGRVETAYLPEGYIPLGTAELGGIIYIVSYNPLIDKCQIGSFPSPERNVSTSEAGKNVLLNTKKYYDGKLVINNFQSIQSPYIRLEISLNELNPGDKFLIAINGENTYLLSAYGQLNGFNPDLLPRYLKLNVISISENGKLNNLNEYLTWQPISDKTPTMYYYLYTGRIDLSNGKPDLDEYRNLVSSNYSVFNSKTSGKLGILAELECIDTFEVSWDAISVEEGGEKIWYIYLYTNWTYDNVSARDKINLYGIAYSYNSVLDTIIFKNYPKSSGDNCTNDILDPNNENNENTIFYTPKAPYNLGDYTGSIEEINNYYKDIDNVNPRRNDGTDNQFLITTPIKVIADKGSESQIINLDIYPMMPFGILEWLGQSFEIDIAKLGSGEINLIEYRYYVDDSSITLNWGLEAYPERNKKIKSVTFNFYLIDDSIINKIKQSGTFPDTSRVIKLGGNESWEETQLNNSFSDLSNPLAQIVVNNKTSYSGHFTQEFSRDLLITNFTYLVSIAINYNDEKEIIYYRILFNHQMLNSYYTKENITDYSTIILNDIINLLLTVNTELDTIQSSPNYTILDSNGNEIDSLPSYLMTPSEEYFNYNINQDHLIGILTYLSVDVNELFNIEIPIDPMSTILEGATWEATNNALQTLLILSSLLGENYWIEDITSYIDLSTTLGIYEKESKPCILTAVTIKNLVPLQVLYNYQTLMGIRYTLLPLMMDSMYINCHTMERHINMWASPSWVWDIVENSDAGDDEDKKTLPLSGYVNTYESIKLSLSGNDVIVLLAKVSARSDSGALGLFTAWGAGSLITDSNMHRKSPSDLGKQADGGDYAYRLWRAIWDWGDNSTNNLDGHYGGFLVMYAMKNAYDEVILFTFDTKSDKTVGTWCTLPETLPNMVIFNSPWDVTAPPSGVFPFISTYVDVWDNIYPPIVNYNDIENNPDKEGCLLEPFKGYYKCEESNGSQNIYTYSFLNYYPSFNLTVKINYDILHELLIYINKNILLSEEILMNNLKINKEYYLKFSAEVTNRIDTNSIINPIINTSSSMYFILLPDGELIDGVPLSENWIVDKNGNQITSITHYNDVDRANFIATNSEDPSPNDFSPTGLRIRLYNGQMIIELDRTTANNKIAAHLRGEELSYSITGIDLLGRDIIYPS